MKKQYVVFGAGRFGRSIAVTLQSRGCEVIVVDRDPEVIEDIADEVSYAICANVEDPDIFAGMCMFSHDVQNPFYINNGYRKTVIGSFSCIL